MAPRENRISNQLRQYNDLQKKWDHITQDIFPVLYKNAFRIGTETVDFAAIGFTQKGYNRLGKVGSIIHHLQQDTVDLEFGIVLPFHLIYCFEQLLQAFGVQTLCLDKDYDCVGGCQRIGCVNIHERADSQSGYVNTVL